MAPHDLVKPHRSSTGTDWDGSTAPRGSSRSYWSVSNAMATSWSHDELIAGMGRGKGGQRSPIITYCITVKGVPATTGTRGAIVVRPISASWRKVLYLLIVVGCTSADGSEKSQYRMKVFGGGKEIHRK